VKIYTEDKRALKTAVQKNPERLSVSEMMRGKPPAGKKERPRLDLRRIARYFRERMQDAYEAVTSRGLWQQRIEEERGLRHDR